MESLFIHESFDELHTMNMFYSMQGIPINSTCCALA